MAGNEVFALGTFIFDCASRIQAVGNDWYRASAEWEDFPRKVQRLKIKCDFWKVNIARFGMSSDIALIESLYAAKFALQKEELRMKRNSRANGRWFSPGFLSKLSMTVFPAKLGLSIERVINAFDDIQKLLKDEDENRILLHKRLVETPSSLAMREDSRYVPLKDSEAAICAALNDPRGPAVVLLHGGPGKGKTTLVGNICVRYRDRATRPEVLTDPPETLFDQIVFLECGPKAKIEEKQSQLLQHLVDQQDASQDKGDTPSIRIRRLLMGHLKDQKILIVLDDVCDEEFLQSIVELCGRSVKCLVTSQLEALCRRPNSTFISIRIQDVEPEDARKVLASHVGLPNQQIPSHLQGIADKMILEAEANPLALATLGAAIGYQSDELEMWETVSRDVFRTLELEKEKKPAFIHGMRYPRSYLPTIRLCMTSLNMDARKLLYLTYLCEGPSVPEEVILVLYQSKRFRSDSGLFTGYRKDLENLGLLKIITHDVYRIYHDKRANLKRSWSLHSLQKRFLEKEMAEDIDILLTSFVGEEPESREKRLTINECQEWEEAELGENHQSTISQALDEAVVSVLCVLYFDKTFLTKATSKRRVPEDLKEVRRFVIEPITRLLGHPVSERWTEIELEVARRVFLRYICNSTLDEDSISTLLSSPVSAPAMFVVLHVSYIIHGISLLTENSKGFINALVSLLADRVDSLVQQGAARTLMNLASEKWNTKFLVQFSSGIFDGMVRSLGKSSDPELQTCCAGTLANLCMDHNVRRKRILNHSGALAGLVHSLTEDKNLELQQQAARAIGNLACHPDDESKSQIIQHPWALQRLLESLSKDDNPRLQECAVRALLNLASGGDEIKRKVAHYPGALARLVISLSKDDNRVLQQDATQAISNLARGGDGIQRKILYHPGALAEPMNSLSMDGNPGLQENAAQASYDLTRSSSYNEIKLQRFFHHRGPLEGLLESMFNDGNHHLQEFAARTWGNVAVGGDEFLRNLLHHPQAVACLLNSLLQDCNPDLQRAAARAIFYLTQQPNCQIKTQIEEQIQAHIQAHIQAQTPYHQGALAGLLEALSNDDNPLLQGMAGWIQNALASWEHEMKMKPLHYPRAVAGLMKLSKDYFPVLHQGAARALCNLASHADDEVKALLLRHWGAQSGLLESLDNDDNYLLQEQSPTTSVSLSSGEYLCMGLLLQYQRAIPWLLNFLSKDNDPGLQGAAAAALFELTLHPDNKIKAQIIYHRLALKGVLQSLFEDKNVLLQGMAACIWANLASGGDEIKRKLLYHLGVLAGLVHSLRKDGDPVLQAAAPLPIFIQTSNQDNEIMSQIIHHQQTLEGLVDSLSKDDNPGLQETSARTWVSRGCWGDEIKRRIFHRGGPIAGLVNSLSKDYNPGLQQRAAAALCKLASHQDDEIKAQLLHHRGVLDGILQSLSNDNNPAIQRIAARTWGNLAEGGYEIRRKIVHHQGALAGLSRLLSRDKPESVSLEAARTIGILAGAEDTRESLRAKVTNGLLDGFERLLDGLERLLDEKVSPSVQMVAIQPLTWIDPARGNEARLHSSPAYSHRGYANFILGMYQESLTDLNKADGLQPRDLFTLRLRCTVRAKLEDFEGAMVDADKIIGVGALVFGLQERGVLGRMMGDLEGALADLDEGLKLQIDNYEMLKHRGYVKFLMKDYDGARVDAESAMRIKPPSVDRSGYGKSCLGVTSVEFLDYKFR